MIDFHVVKEKPPRFCIILEVFFLSFPNANRLLAFLLRRRQSILK